MRQAKLNLGPVEQESASGIPTGREVAGFAAGIPMCAVHRSRSVETRLAALPDVTERTLHSFDYYRSALGRRKNDSPVSLRAEATVSRGALEYYDRETRWVRRFSKASSFFLLMLLYGGCGILDVLVEKTVTHHIKESIYRGLLDNAMSMFLAFFVVLSDDWVGRKITKGVGVCFSRCSRESSEAIAAHHRAQAIVRAHDAVLEKEVEVERQRRLSRVVVRAASRRSRRGDKDIVRQEHRARYLQQARNVIADAAVVGLGDYLGRACVQLLLIKFGDKSDTDHNGDIDFTPFTVGMVVGTYILLMMLLHRYRFSEPVSRAFAWAGSQAKYAQFSCCGYNERKQHAPNQSSNLAVLGDIEMGVGVAKTEPGEKQDVAPDRLPEVGTAVQNPMRV